MRNFIKSLLIILLFVLMIYLFYHFVFVKFQNKHSLEKSSLKINESSQNSPFSISKIVMYSSGYGENKNTSFQQSSWILDIFQYSDIAIYIEPAGNELHSSNTVKKLWLEEISVSHPKLGSASLYYLDSLNFGTPNIDENYELADSIEFTVLNDTNETSDIQYNTPIFFTDCSNPITLKYVNQKIKENYTITSNEPVFFNGKLLKMAGVALEDLKANIDFTIHLQSNDKQEFSYHLSLPICLENENVSILDGSVLVENEYENYKFMEEF